MVFGHGKNNKRKIDNDLSWYGHRGLLRSAPENTLQGFSAAIDEGLRSVEIDVLRTKDGKIVCSHNFDLERETDGSGYIDQKTLSELELIDAATNWPNAEAKIPTLESVLAQLPKECGVNIEIKASKPIDWLTPVGVIKIIKKLKLLRKLSYVHSPGEERLTQGQPSQAKVALCTQGSCGDLFLNGYNKIT